MTHSRRLTQPGREDTKAPPCPGWAERRRVLVPQEALQLTLGQFQFPFAMMVTPQLLPLPLGVATRTWLLGHVPLMFQVALIRAGLGTVMVTVHELEPLPETFRLCRSLHLCPAESDAEQLPPPGVVGVVVGVVVPVPVGVVVGVVVV